ncbi:MAG: hypothetical protein ACI9JD_001138 [Rhodococcus sp. (in: high G+C Gram-positive bacteria)]
MRYAYSTMSNNSGSRERRQVMHCESELLSSAEMVARWCSVVRSGSFRSASSERWVVEVRASTELWNVVGFICAVGQLLCCVIRCP